MVSSLGMQYVQDFLKKLMENGNSFTLDGLPYHPMKYGKVWRIHGIQSGNELTSDNCAYSVYVLPSCKSLNMNKKILTLGSEIEAIRIKEILDSNEIPYIIRSYHDSAYDGLFQHQYGWGVLEADEKNEARILDLLKDLMAE